MLPEGSGNLVSPLCWILYSGPFVAALSVWICVCSALWLCVAISVNISERPFAFGAKVWWEENLTLCYGTKSTFIGHHETSYTVHSDKFPWKRLSLRSDITEATDPVKLHEPSYLVARCLRFLFLPICSFSVTVYTGILDVYKFVFEVSVELVLSLAVSEV